MCICQVNDCYQSLVISLMTVMKCYLKNASIRLKGTRAVLSRVTVNEFLEMDWLAESLSLII